MNEAFLQTTRPSDGLNTVLGNIPASSAPAKGGLAVMNPSVHNRVKEPMINPVASYPILVRPWKNNWQHMLHAGDLIFVNRSDELNKRMHKVNKLQQRFPELVVANLPLLNYLLRQNSLPKPMKNGQAVEHSRTAKALGDIKQWSFLGVMRNDMQVSGTSEYRTNASDADKTQAMRLINVDVRGTTRPFNYWQHAQVGSHVYLQVATMDVRGIPSHDNALDNLVNARKAMQRYNVEVLSRERAIQAAEPQSAERTALEASLESYKQGHTVTQVLPVTGNGGMGLLETDIPSQKETFARGPLYIGHNVMYVGWVFQHLGSAEISANSPNIWNATQFFDDRFRLPVIPIMMRT